MNKQQAIVLLKEQIEKIKDLKNGVAFPPKYQVWENSVNKILPVLFSKDEIDLFNDISVDQWARDDSHHYELYLDVLNKKEEMLKELINEYLRFNPVVDGGHEWNKDQVDTIVDDYWQNGKASCPVDETPLNIQRIGSIGKSSEDLIIHCPRCGRHARWSAEPEARGEKKSEIIIKEGKEFTARKAIKEIINIAVVKVQIIDQYFKGDEAFSLLLDLSPQTNVEILISPDTNSSSFRVILNKFKSEWRGQIEVKTANDLHGRHIIIDNKDVYIIDHSLKDAGNKLTYIGKVDETKQILDHFTAKWLSGTVV